MIGSFTKHSFVLKVLKKLYVARTQEEDLFLDPSHNNAEMARMKTLIDLNSKDDHGIRRADSNINNVTKQMKMNKIIKVRFRDNLRLFLINKCKCLQKKYQKDKLWKMYN